MSTATVKIKLKSLPTKTIEMTDTVSVIEQLIADGPTAYSCTYDQARVVDQAARRAHPGHRIALRAIEANGGLIGYTLSFKPVTGSKRK